MSKLKKIFNEVFKFNIGDLVVHKSDRSSYNRYLIIERNLNQDCEFNFGKTYAVRSVANFSEGKIFNFLEIELERLEKNG